MENYYQDLLSRETKSGNNSDHRSMELEDTDSTKELSADECAVEKWKAQIDKVSIIASYIQYILLSILLLH